MLLIFHFHANLLQLLSEPGNPIVLQDCLMKLCEFFLIKFCITAAILVWQDMIEGLRYRRLYPYGNVFLNEVLNHSEMVTMIVCVYLELAEARLYLLYVTMKVCGVALGPADLINLVLQLLEPLIMHLLCFLSFLHHPSHPPDLVSLGMQHISEVKLLLTHLLDLPY